MSTGARSSIRPQARTRRRCAAHEPARDAISRTCAPSLQRTEVGTASACARPHGAGDRALVRRSSRSTPGSCERERERMRAELAGPRRGAGGAAATRAGAGAAGRIAPLFARLARHEALERLEKQLQEPNSAPRRAGRQLKDGEAPARRARARARAGAAVRAQVEEELHAAKLASDELEALLRERDARSHWSLEQRVDGRRAAMDEARGWRRSRCGCAVRASPSSWRRTHFELPGAARRACDRGAGRSAGRRQLAGDERQDRAAWVR